MNNEEKVSAVANGDHVTGDWSSWDTACLTQFAMDNPDHSINDRLDVQPISGKVYDERFGGGGQIRPTIVIRL